jgi:hypothetical protein
MTTNSTPAEIPTSVSEQQRLDEQWRGVSIQDLASRHLAPFVGENTGRVTYQGQSLLLPPGPAQTLGLALHELVTNAVKYGALSVPTGKVHLAWHQEASRFRMSWIEHDGPPPPLRHLKAGLAVSCSPASPLKLWTDKPRSSSLQKESGGLSMSRQCMSMSLRTRALSASRSHPRAHSQQASTPSERTGRPVIARPRRRTSIACRRREHAAGGQQRAWILEGGALRLVSAPFRKSHLSRLGHKSRTNHHPQNKCQRRLWSQRNL